MKEMLDIQDAVVEVLISADGGTVWINNKDHCLVRIGQITKLTVRDDRTLVDHDRPQERGFV